jgi:hypothetical protein
MRTCLGKPSSIKDMRPSLSLSPGNFFSTDCKKVLEKNNISEHELVASLCCLHVLEAKKQRSGTFHYEQRMMRKLTIS